MSGQANAKKTCEWFGISVLDQLCRVIPTRKMPDGSTKGPAEYFAGKKLQYLEWIGKIDKSLTDKLIAFTQLVNVSLLPFNKRFKAIKKIGSYTSDEPCNYQFTVTPKKSRLDVTIFITVSASIAPKDYKIILDGLRDSIKY